MFAGNASHSRLEFCRTRPPTTRLRRFPSSPSSSSSLLASSFSLFFSLSFSRSFRSFRTSCPFRCPPPPPYPSVTRLDLDFVFALRIQQKILFPLVASIVSFDCDNSLPPLLDSPRPSPFSLFRLSRLTSLPTTSLRWHQRNHVPTRTTPTARARRRLEPTVRRQVALPQTVQQPTALATTQHPPPTARPGGRLPRMLRQRRPRPPSLCLQRRWRTRIQQ